VSLKYRAIGATFEALSLSRIATVVRHLSKSRGVILTLHRVLPEAPAEFSPNAILQVTPDFLEYVIIRVRQLGLDIVSLDEALRRLEAPKASKRFVVLTFDDAYRDNLQYALPILRKHAAPFTLYVPTAYIDGKGELWWQAIEDIIARRETITVPGNGGSEEFTTRTTAEKQAAFDRLYWHMRKMPEPERLLLLHAFAETHDYDLAGQCRDLIMDWQELQTFADEPLCTLGAHTVHHYELAKLPIEEARAEMAESADVLLGRFGHRPQHFSYPLGGPLSAGEREFDLARELGFRSAVTTRPGGLYAHHAKAAASLPRVSLNGYFQNRRYVDVFATGAIFSAMGKVTG
jgi:peptidoglycan/xylan/chitin deacetylase (PgdA/CDA1 family)